MDNSINYPKSVTEKKIVQDFIAVVKRFKCSQPTIDAIYKDLNADPAPTYPDGTWDPIEDLNRIGKFTFDKQ